MRKILALLLAIAMILSLSACGKEKGDDSDSTGDDGNVESNGNNSDNSDNSEDGSTPDSDELVYDESLEGTKFLALIQGISNDNIAIDMGMGNTKMIVNIDGNNVYVNISGDEETAEEVLIFDSVRYEFNHSNKTYTAVALDEDELETNIRDFDGFYLMFTDIKGMVFGGTGTEEFMGEERYYEEIIHGGQYTARYFFDGDSLVGTLTDGEAVAMFLSVTVPEGAFDLPEGYEKVDVLETAEPEVTSNPDED